MRFQSIRGAYLRDNGMMKANGKEALDRPLYLIYVDTIASLFDEYKKNVCHYRAVLEEKILATKDFVFYDLFGNGLIFYRDL